jgi:hypothetical protein
MLKSVQGSYHDGQIELDEVPQGVEQARVVVTFLPEQGVGSRVRSRLAGLLEDRVRIEGGDTDVVRDALNELRAERSARLEGWESHAASEGPK